MNKFVVINDELRLGSVNDFKDLIGDNDENDVKFKGYWRIIHRIKTVYFYGDFELDNSDILSDIKKNGFYSPSIQGYKWLFSGMVDQMNNVEIK